MPEPGPGPALLRLLGVMARLRAKDGCPWDREQTFQSIAPYTIEEGYEVADAIVRGDQGGLPDELGDLLFQVVYHAQMASEMNLFSFEDVSKNITNKMIARHPHVFGEGDQRSAEAQSLAWEDAKAAERRARAEDGALAGVPVRLPALTRAAKLSKRAARVGFDWPDAAAVLLKLEEETGELKAELPDGDASRLGDELGDMLFVIANLARKLELDPEACLRNANAKFERRFRAVEDRLAAEGRSPAEASLAEMETLWTAAKRAERT